MPKITDMQIQKNNKTRANVYLDGEFAFGLEMVTVMKLGLKIGKDVDVDTINQAVFDSEVSVAFAKAMDYLSRSMKTTKQMHDYLVKKGFSQSVVDCVIQKLQGYKYLDDELYSRLYTNQNKGRKGVRRIKQELAQKGIATVKIDEQVQIDDDEQLANATTLAQKYLKNKTCDMKTMQKLQRYLLYRGFDYDVVNKVVRQFRSFDEFDDDN